MAEEQLDPFGRPLRFRPGWPPQTAEKQTVGWKPGFSLAFRKAGWPPPSADDEVSESSGAGASAVNGPSSNNSASVTNPSQGGAGLPSSQNNAGATVKPKRAVRDYSGFYAKNAAPPSRRVYVVQPGSVQLPEAFTGGNAEESDE